MDVYGPDHRVASHHQKYYASGSTNVYHVNQSLQGGGSLDSDLAQGSNQCVSMSVGRCQQAPNRNMSLGCSVIALESHHPPS